MRQRPRRASQLTSGTFSHQVSVRLHWRQWERGLTTLSPAGQRLRHTFRKLPKASPSRPAKIVPRMRIIDEVEYTALREHLCRCRNASARGVIRGCRGFGRSAGLPESSAR